MITRLLFHEKCTADIHTILHDLTQGRKNRKDHFLARITEAYQNLFENPASGQNVFERDTPWNEKIDKRVYPVCDFPYFLVTTQLSDTTIVVLGIIGTASYYKMVADKLLRTPF